MPADRGRSGRPALAKPLGATALDLDGPTTAARIAGLARRESSRRSDEAITHLTRDHDQTG